MILSIKKIYKIIYYFFITYTLLYDNTVIAKNITETFKKIQVEEKIKVLPDIELLRIDENEIHLKKLNKNNKLIINFWATWCTPCITEMPDLSELAKILKNSNIKIIFINQDQLKDIDKVSSFVEKYELNYRNIFIDTKMRLSKLFKLRGLPTTLITNETGDILWRIEGIIDWKDKKIIDWLTTL